MLKEPEEIEGVSECIGRRLRNVTFDYDENELVMSFDKGKSIHLYVGLDDDDLPCLELYSERKEDLH